jgi:hypothetical protein
MHGFGHLFGRNFFVVRLAGDLICEGPGLAEFWRWPRLRLRLRLWLRLRLRLRLRLWFRLWFRLRLWLWLWRCTFSDHNRRRS